MYHTIGTSLKWLLGIIALTVQIRSLLSGALFLYIVFNFIVCLLFIYDRLKIKYFCSVRLQ